MFPDEPHPPSASKQASVRNQPGMAAFAEKNRRCRNGRYCIFENGCGRLREEECCFQIAYQQIRLWLRPGGAVCATLRNPSHASVAKTTTWGTIRLIFAGMSV